MMPNWTPEGLQRQLRAAKRSGVYAAAVTSAQRHGLDLAVWLAVGSRESGLKNVVGDGGMGHGPWQLDSRSHHIPEGLAALADACAAVLEQAIRQAHQHGLSGDAALKVGLAAYNSGFGNAWRGHLAGDADRYTAHGDYAKDTLARAVAIRNLLT